MEAQWIWIGSGYRQLWWRYRRVYVCWFDTKKVKWLNQWLNLHEFEIMTECGCNMMQADMLFDSLSWQQISYNRQNDQKQITFQTGHWNIILRPKQSSQYCMNSSNIGRTGVWT